MNEPKLHVETSLTAIGYAERMIRLADQFRREGNHAAANGALLMAWDIRENSEHPIDILANLTPEHAELLGQSERQRLATEINASYENLNRLGEEHASTEDQWDECNEQEIDWYKSCFEVGLTAHLADAIVAGAEGLPQNEDNVEMVVDAVSKCCKAARESLEYSRNHKPPADAPFPQTRQQSMEQAIDDCVRLEQLDRQIGEKLKAVEQEADNSPGRCHLCGIVVRAEDVRAHAQSCVREAFQSKFGNDDLTPGNTGNATFLIWVRADEVRQWMMLAVRPNTSLLQFDQFLRNLWLECCGHQSRFEISDTRYGAHVRSTGGTRYADTYLAEPDERNMMHTVEQTVPPGELFRHEYDYDNVYSTSLNLECVAVLPTPYDRLLELIDPPESAEGYTDDFIAIVARNLPLAVLHPGRSQ